MPKTISNGFAVTTAVDGVSYEITLSIESLRLNDGDNNVSQSVACRCWRKEGDGAKTAQSCFWGAYVRDVNNGSDRYVYRTRTTSASSASKTLTVGSLNATLRAIVIYAVSSNPGTGNTPPSTYLAKREIPITVNGKLDDIVEQVTYYLLTSSSTAPDAPTESAMGNWTTTRGNVYMNTPYLWRCVKTHYRISGWKFGPVEIDTVYTPQTRIITPVDWAAMLGGSYFYKGDPGEPYRDVYLDTDNAVFLEARSTNQCLDSTAPLILQDGEWVVNTTYWKSSTYFPSLGVGFLAVMKAHVKELVVGELKTETNQDGMNVSVTGGLLRATHAASNQYAEFGVKNGILVLNFYKDDRLLLSLGPDDIIDDMSVRNSSYASLTGRRSASSNAGGTKINLTTTGSTIYKLTEGIQLVSNVKKYTISQSTTPSVFDAKYLKSSFSDALLKTDTLSNCKALDGWYLYQASSGTAMEVHIVDGVAVERREILYTDLGTGYGVVNSWSTVADR